MQTEYSCCPLREYYYQTCKQFYCDILGFEVVFADEKNEYAELAKGEILVTIFNCQKSEDSLDENKAVYYDFNDAGIALNFRIASV